VDLRQELQELQWQLRKLYRDVPDFHAEIFQFLHLVQYQHEGRKE
jgi:hypothetical protein